MQTRNRRTAVALAAACANGAFAMDVAGFEFTGYSRGGPVFNQTDGVKGNLALGGELQKYRLGNEGDNGIEIDLIKRFETSGIKWKGSTTCPPSGAVAMWAPTRPTSK